MNVISFPFFAPQQKKLLESVKISTIQHSFLAIFCPALKYFPTFMVILYIIAYLLQAN